MSSPPRQHPRYAHETEVTIRCAGQPLIVGRTRNVSRGGFCVHAAQNLPLGTRADIALQLVFEASNAVASALVLSAHVVWATRLEDEYQLGFAFRHTPASERGMDSLLKKLEAVNAPDENLEDDVFAALKG